MEALGAFWLPKLGLVVEALDQLALVVTALATNRLQEQVLARQDHQMEALEVVPVQLVKLPVVVVVVRIVRHLLPKSVQQAKSPLATPILPIFRT